MTDQRLHDLLHESVSEASMPDLSDAAWRFGVRSRRRRSAGLAAVATAVVVAVAGTVALIHHRGPEPGVSTGPDHSPSSPTSPSTTPSVSPYLPGDGRPDARYSGLPVWWSPTLAQETNLPAFPHSPLPATIDLQQPRSSLTLDPIRRAVAAFAVVSGSEVKSVDVLGRDGLLRNVTIAAEPGGSPPVQPMTDPEGTQRVRVGPSLLSRSGAYLMFPQNHSVLIYTLRTGRWQTIHTGSADTWDATWIGNTRIALADPARPLAVVPEYSIDGTFEGSGNVAASGLPDVRLRSSQIYGRARTGRHGVAQALSAGDPIPEPPGSGWAPGSSDWINVNAVHPAILLMSAEAGRQKECCQVDGWIAPDTVLYDSSSSSGLRLMAWRAKTGRFWQVSRIVGVAPGQERVVASYAQFAAAGAPLPY